MLENVIVQFFDNWRFRILEHLENGIFTDLAIVQQRHAVPEEHQRRLLGRTVQLDELTVLGANDVGVQRLPEVRLQIDQLRFVAIAFVAFLFGCCTLHAQN